jgi:6-phosphogluconolactonase
MLRMIGPALAGDHRPGPMIQLIPVMDIRTYPNAPALMDAAAADFVAVAAAAIAERGRCLVALSGGSTPRGMYERLAALGPGILDWSRVTVLWSDERSVPPDHAESNYRMALETLLAPLQIPAAQVYRMRGEDEDLEAAARDYERTLGALTGVHPGHGVPHLDLVLLGLGSDGHTASLFGDTVALDVRDRWVVRNYVAKFTTSRLTLTFPVILAAREIRVLVAGADKANTLAAVLAGDWDPDRLPAQRLAHATGHVVWLVDQAAAAHVQARADG